MTEPPPPPPPVTRRTLTDLSWVDEVRRGRGPHRLPVPPRPAPVEGPAGLEPPPEPAGLEPFPEPSVAVEPAVVEPSPAPVEEPAPAPVAVLVEDEPPVEPPVDRAPVAPQEPPPAEEEPDVDERRSPTRSLVEWGAVVVGALVVALVIKAFLLQAFYIPSSSMEPTLEVRDRVLVNKLSYRLHDVNRGDLVVFERPAGESEQVRDLIKRVVALPGETIEIRDNVVRVDSRALDEPYLPDGSVTGDVPVQTVPEDHVWVMGDNRSDSRDSRFFGPIDEDLIVGRAFVRVWPLGDLSLL